MKQPVQPPVSHLPLERFLFHTVFLDESGGVVEQPEKEAWVFTETAGECITLAMVYIPGGTFQMGSLHELGYPDEKPQHLVTVMPFFMGRSPVTQGQWQAVMHSKPYVRFPNPELPIDNVSYQDGHAFCERLSMITGRMYTLPSEAQWEYACRGGGQTTFSTGKTITTDYANYAGLHTYLDELQGVYRHMSTQAGTFPPNSYGLLDMHGNLWEYCADRWHADYTGAPFDDAPWEQGGEIHFRTARGGSWHEPPINCRCATRLRVNETERDDLYGFRIALRIQ